MQRLCRGLPHRWWEVFQRFIHSWLRLATQVMRGVLKIHSFLTSTCRTGQERCFKDSFIHSFIHSFISDFGLPHRWWEVFQRFIHSFIYSFIDSSIDWFIYPLIHCWVFSDFPYRMTSEESALFIRQMLKIYSMNRSQWEPFNLFLCNYDESQKNVSGGCHD
jgi:hypothetical protein